MCHSVNEAVIRAFQFGLLQSATWMVPCPWSLHAMHFLAEHPEISFGVHLTAISDWVDYCWGPLTPRQHVPSLIQSSGYFHNFEQMPEFLANVNLHEMEIEFRAQIETVLAAGLHPTHLDWHSLRISGRDNIIELMFKLATEYRLVLRVSEAAWIEKAQRQGLPTNDYHFMDSYFIDPEKKAGINIGRGLIPALCFIIPSTSRRESLLPLPVSPAGAFQGWSSAQNAAGIPVWWNTGSGGRVHRCARIRG